MGNLLGRLRHAALLRELGELRAADAYQLVQAAGAARDAPTCRPTGPPYSPSGTVCGHSWSMPQRGLLFGLMKLALCSGLPG
ncbi:MAG: hypothetical protein ACRYFX_15860 [Janthinobacterium lividum]